VEHLAQQRCNFLQNKDRFHQCFRSGSGSVRIRIEIAPLDPDPYWEYGSGSRTVKMVSKKEKILDFNFQVKKSIDHFAKGLMIISDGIT